MALDFALGSDPFDRFEDPAKFHDVIAKARDRLRLCQLNPANPRFQQMAQKLSLQARRWRTIIVTLPVMAATSRS